MRRHLSRQAEKAAWIDLENSETTELHAWTTRLPLAPAQSVLELGAGTGRITRRLARDHDVVALDQDPDLLRVLRRRSGYSIPTVCADARDFALPRRFDWVLAPAVFLQQIVSVIGRIEVMAAAAVHLAPDGRFGATISEPERFGEPLPVESVTVDGWRCESQLIDWWDDDDALYLRRRRRIGRKVRVATLPYAFLNAAQVEFEGKLAGLDLVERFEIPDEEYVDATALLFCAARA